MNLVMKVHGLRNSVVLLLLGVAACSGGAAENEKRPLNVLFLMTDQHHAAALGCARLEAIGSRVRYASACHGPDPVTACSATAPSENMSPAAEHAPPAATTGSRYAGVPSGWSGRNRSAIRRAAPRSASLACPDAVNRMLAALTSP